MSDFVDRVTVHVKGGDGGNGSAGIRREKYKPLAGPNGGNAVSYTHLTLPTICSV